MYPPRFSPSSIGIPTFVSDDHPRRDGFVCAGIDEDERTGDSVPPIGIMDEWDGGAQGNATDVVHVETIHTFDFVKCVDVHMVFDLLDDGFGLMCRVTDDQFCLWRHGFV